MKDDLLNQVYRNDTSNQPAETAIVIFHKMENGDMGKTFISDTKNSVKVNPDGSYRSIRPRKRKSNKGESDKPSSNHPKEYLTKESENIDIEITEKHVSKKTVNIKRS
jgi:hypothetical protein